MATDQCVEFPPLKVIILDEKNRKGGMTKQQETHKNREPSGRHFAMLMHNNNNKNHYNIQ